MKSNKIFYLIVSLLILLTACSEPADDATISDVELSVHGSGVLISSSSDFHGNLPEGGLAECQSCHGGDYSGGIAEEKCTKCHSAIDVHSAGTTMINHKSYLATINWDLSKCQSCHDENYSGGVSSPTCLSCHDETGGPENCSTCHFDNEVVEPTGFHAAHLNAEKTDNIVCSECHTVPQNFSDAGHIDNSSGAEIIFGDLSKTVTNEQGTARYNSDLATVTPSPSYSNGSCANVYCHGEFKNGNMSQTISMSDNIVCGSCHGDASTMNPLPPEPHFQIENCYACHGAVVDENQNIIDMTKHINGKLNVFGSEEDY